MLRMDVLCEIILWREGPSEAQITREGSDVEMSPKILNLLKVCIGFKVNATDLLCTTSSCLLRYVLEQISHMKFRGRTGSWVFRCWESARAVISLLHTGQNNFGMFVGLDLLDVCSTTWGSMGFSKMSFVAIASRHAWMSFLNWWNANMWSLQWLQINPSLS